MDSEKRFELVCRNSEEILTPEDLRSYIERGFALKHYIGFEISGFVHLGIASTAMKIADFQKAEIPCSIFLATWHAWINKKLDGSLETIRRIAGGYFKEAMGASLEVFGAEPEKIEFVSGDELYHNNDLYWQLVMEICKLTTIKRAMRSTTIMGRKEGELLDLGSLLYAPMQVADIFMQDISLAHAGTDQRKAQVIARELAERLESKPLLLDKKEKEKKFKPVAVHGHLLLGLQKPPLWPIPKEQMQEYWSSMKMSKSIPGTAIFLHDSEEEIREKIAKAFCPEKETEFNPIMDWAKHLVFAKEKAVLEIEREQKFGGNTSYASFNDLEKDYSQGKLHPLDLKNAIAAYVIELLEPARKRFSKPKNAKLLEEMKEIKGKA